MTLRALAKYGAFVCIARRQAQRERAELYGRMAFFGVVLLVFSALWQAVAESGMPLKAQPETLVWYLAVTEWIVLGVPPVFVAIEEDVKRGDLAYRLPRPASYVATLLAEGIGQLSVRMPALGLVGCGFAWLFTGRLPEEPAVLLWIVPLVFLSAAVLLTFYVVLGLLAFWVADVAPLYWVFQKLLFVLGGLMLPLELYPEVILRVAAFTPFPSLLYGPGSLVLGHSNWIRPAANLGFWLLFSTALAAFLFRRARRVLELNGG